MSKPAIIILGAGLGGSIAAFEIKQAVGARADVTVVAQGDSFYFVPSNPWVAVGWRDRASRRGGACARCWPSGGIALRDPAARSGSMPVENRVELNDGSELAYDYLVIATGPDLAFDEIEGLGPVTATPSRSATIDHAEKAAAAFDRVRQGARARSWSARCRAPPASARPTSSR